MFRDVKNNGQFSKDSFNVGTFFPTVKSNLSRDNVKYTYFIKKDSRWKHFIFNFRDSYRDVENIDHKVTFVMVNSDKYFFYDEIYLYKNKDNDYSAFEFLPSISNEEEVMLYYLELDSKQTDRLISIKENLIEKYKIKTLSQLC